MAKPGHRIATSPGNRRRRGEPQLRAQASCTLAMIGQRPHMRFTPTSASCSDSLKRFFRGITTEGQHSGVLSGVPELIAAIEQHIAHHGRNPKPYVFAWSARDILHKVIRAISRFGWE